MDAKERPFRRLKKGLPNLHAAEEGCRNYEGSNPGHARYNGLNGGNLKNMSSAQDDISFKRNVHMIRIKKRGRAAKAVYDELLDSLFSGWENHIGNPVHAEAGNSLPLVFSFGDEDAEENTENDKYQEQEDLWMECGIAFQSMNIGSNGCEEVFNLLLYYHSAYTLFLTVVFLILRMLCPV
jgi:DNA repair and recombination protein RAD54 and RAD54-like protein